MVSGLRWSQASRPYPSLLSIAFLTCARNERPTLAQACTAQPTALPTHAHSLESPPRRCSHSHVPYSIHCLPPSTSPQHIRWLKEHFSLNGFPSSTYDIKRAKFGQRRSSGKQNSTAPWFSLSELLEGLEHVDYLDLDAQDGERYLVQNTDDSAALRKVRRIHVETHSDASSAVVIATLESHGFRILRNATASLFEVYHTPVGPVLYRGGAVYAANRYAPNTLDGAC